MIENSLPPSDRTEREGAPIVTTAAPAGRVAKAHDAQLIRRMTEYLAGTLFEWQTNLAGTGREVSAGKVAAEIGMSRAVIHEWLHGDYKGDVAKVELKLRAVLAAAERRLLLGVATVPTHSTERVEVALRIIRRSNQIGLVYGDSGVGKSRGCEWAVSPLNPAGNHGAILVSAAPWLGHRHALARLLINEVGKEAFAALGTKTKQGRARRQPDPWEFLVQSLAGSNRLIIVDEAHLLDTQAVTCMRILYDRTSCPIALVGNIELMERFDANEQWCSRVGFRCEISSDAGGRKALIRHMLREIVPAAESALADVASELAKGMGHFRTVEKVLQLCVALREADADASWPVLFEEARKCVTREADAKRKN